MESESLTQNFSESILHALRNAYNSFGGSENKEIDQIVCSILSIPPIVSVLRVNTLKEDILSAKDSLQKQLDKKYASSSKSFQVSLHDKIPDILIVTPSGEHRPVAAVKNEIIVGELCGLAVLRGADVFAPGVMGAPQGMKAKSLVAVYADLDSKCRKGFTKIYMGRKHFVGNGEALMSRDELFKDCSSPSKGVAVEMTFSLFGLPSFDGLDNEIYFPQNLPSVLVAHNLEIVEGEMILDMCAAPGGKTTHAAILLKNSGKVIAIDKSKSKIKRMEKNCLQQNLRNVICYAHDSTELCHNKNECSSGINGPPFPPESFDKIILDPPCSALGQRPQLQCNMTSKELESFPVYQKKLIRQAVQLLKPGGILIYSTCTLTVDENENQVAWVLRNFKELHLSTQAFHVGRQGIPGHELDDANCKLVQRIDPCITNIIKRTPKNFSVNEDTIGFFIAKFRKSTDS
eukprot:gene5570-6258_t